jgi:hypothetical protein
MSVHDESRIYTAWHWLTLTAPLCLCLSFTKHLLNINNNKKTTVIRGDVLIHPNLIRF